MTRLTNEIRDSIARKAISHAFKAEKEQHKKDEHTLGMELYNSIFDKKVLAIVKRMPQNWLRQDSCLRFNCAGYDLTFCLNKAVPVPYSTHCARLGNITGDLGAKGQKFAEKTQDIKDRESKATRALGSVLYSVTTIKRLKEIWPEGKEFYTMYDEVSPQSKGGVPAVQINEINAMLGLKGSGK